MFLQVNLLVFFKNVHLTAITAIGPKRTVDSGFFSLLNETFNSIVDSLLFILSTGNTKSCRWLLSRELSTGFYRD